MSAPNAAAVPPRRVTLLGLCLLAVVVGLVTGGGAVLFRMLVTFIHNLFFAGEVTVIGNDGLIPESIWGPFIIFAPVIGGLGVVWLVKTFAPEARGHGVPEVMDAIFYRQGVIRPQVALVKSLASALSIGSGAAVGREGPIIQIGSALGSSLAQVLRLSTAQRITLLAAGAGAGIAATFNTPLGAVMFATELMMPEVSTATFLPVVLATGTATYVGRLAFGLQPAFVVPIANLPVSTPLDLQALGAFVLLGLLVGVAAVGFIRLLSYMESAFPRLPGNDYTRNMVGMLGVGLLMYGLFVSFGHYYVAGVGYGVIQGVLQGMMQSLPLLAVLFCAKLLATTLSLGAGASGGVFSPSLFLGATLGGAFGLVAGQVLPDAGINAVDFAMVGMAGMVAAGTGAALTAIIMIFEMTRDYNIIVPMIVAVALAVGMRRLLSKETIYTIKLVARGHHIPKDRYGNMFMVRPVREVMEVPRTIDASLSVSEAVERLAEDPHRPAVAVSGNRICGIIPEGRLLYRIAVETPDMPLSQVIQSRFALVGETTVLYDALKRLGRRDVETALVHRTTGRRIPRADDIVGIITKTHVADSVLGSMKTLN